MIQAADDFRDRRQFDQAATAYAKALALDPLRLDLQVQYGNMLKDAGDIVRAEAAYRCAMISKPEDPDIHLQLGHLFKIAGRWNEAADSYRAACDLDHSCLAARLELLRMGITAYEVAAVSGDRDDSADLSTSSASHARLTAQDRAALEAYPIERWQDLRRSYSIPPPPLTRSSPERIHVMLASCEEDEAITCAQVQSLVEQTLKNFTCCIVTQTSPGPDLSNLIEADSRFTVATSLQAAVGKADGIVIASAAGDLLDRNGLVWFSLALSRGGARGATSDCESLLVEGGRVLARSILLRGPADPDSLLEGDIAGTTIAARAEDVIAAIDRNPDSMAILIRDLALELARTFEISHVPLPLYGSVSGSRLDSDTYGAIVARYLKRHGEASIKISRAPTEQVLSVKRPVGSDSLLSVIIPTRADDDDIFQMVDSLLRLAANPVRLEVIVIENGCTTPASIVRLKALAATGTIRLLHSEGPFNWALINNKAAEHASGDILLFANDDMCMLSPLWDDEVRGHLGRAEVGGLGAKLYYPTGKIQHAGMLMGWGGGTIHDGLDFEGDALGPSLRYIVTRRVAAVTGAFLAVRSKDFAVLRGFDSDRFAVSYNDTDFCFRLRARGLSIIWTPRIRLTHYESKTLGRDQKEPQTVERYRTELERIQREWSKALLRDATVNPFWLDYGRPMRLLRAPTSEAIVRFIQGTGRGYDPYFSLLG